MRGLLVVIVAGFVGLMVACTTTRTEKEMMAPPNDMPMGPPNEKAPQPYINGVTDPARQMPSNGVPRY